MKGVSCVDSCHASLIATYTQEMQQTFEPAKDCLTRAQQRQKAYRDADKGRRDASFRLVANSC